MERPYTKATKDYAEIFLVNPGDHPELAADYISSKLWLSRAEAQDLVLAGYGLIGHKIRRDTATAEIALMAAIGIEAKIADFIDCKTEQLFDVSVRRTSASSISKIRQELRSIGLTRNVMASDFIAPSGLEICDLPHEVALLYVKRLQKLEGVTATICSQEGALLDVMSPPQLTTVEVLEIQCFAKILGCEAISGHGMLATGMTRDQFKMLATRFPDARLVSANRAFERIDLYVTGAGNISVENLVKFTARYGRTATGALAAGKRFRIETNLTRPEARLAFEWLIAIGVGFRAEWHCG